MPHALIGTTLVALSLALAGCSGLDFGGPPGREVAKDTGPLTTPPAHLKVGNSE